MQENGRNLSLMNWVGCHLLNYCFDPVLRVRLKSQGGWALCKYLSATRSWPEQKNLRNIKVPKTTWRNSEKPPDLIIELVDSGMVTYMCYIYVLHYKITKTEISRKRYTFKTYNFHHRVLGHLRLHQQTITWTGSANNCIFSSSFFRHQMN